MGTRQVPFSRELYIEREDFKIEKPKKYRRLYVGNEVRLMNAYFVTCTGYDVDEDGNVTCVYATYDPEEETVQMEERFAERSIGYLYQLRKKQKFVCMKTL